MQKPSLYWQNHYIFRTWSILKVLFCSCHGTRVKTLRLMQYWWKQHWTMFCSPHCSQLSTILNNIVTPDSGSTILFNIVYKCEQRGQQNIVQSCWAAGSAFIAVYNTIILLRILFLKLKNPPKIPLLVTKLSISQTYSGVVEGG
jgi:hypothetical protein